MAGENLLVRCPECGTEFRPPRQTAFKAKATAGGALGGAITGATVGAIYGASAGVAAGNSHSSTMPFGVVGGAIGGLILGIAAKTGVEWAVAKVTCPNENCLNVFRI